MVPGAQIVSTDEFWDGEGFDLDRLEREVVAPLARGETATFASYDWTAGEARGSRTVEPTGVVIVEGVCALHRKLRDAYAVRVWVEASYDVRLARAIARDGEAARKDVGRRLDAVGGPLRRARRPGRLRRSRGQRPTSRR